MSGVGTVCKPGLGDGILEIRTDAIQNAIAAELLAGPWIVNGVRPVGEISGALLEGGDGECGLGGAAVLLVVLPVKIEKRFVSAAVESGQLDRTTNVGAVVVFLVEGAFGGTPLFSVQPPFPRSS